MYSFDVLLSQLQPVHCSMYGSNCCFLTGIQISQEAGKVVWYSHFLKNFPQFVVINRVKTFRIVNEAEVDFFWNSFAFSIIQGMLARMSWCAQGFVWALRASLAVMGFESKCDFSPPPVFLGLLLCPWTWGIFFWWDPTFSCPTLCDPMDSSLPSSAVHGIFQARILEWAAISFSRGSSRARNQT